MEPNSSEIQQNNPEQGKAEVGSGVAHDVPTMNHSKANVAKDALLQGKQVVNRIPDPAMLSI